MQISIIIIIILYDFVSSFSGCCINTYVDSQWFEHVLVSALLLGKKKRTKYSYTENFETECFVLNCDKTVAIFSINLPFMTDKQLHEHDEQNESSGLPVVLIYPG